MNNEKWHINKIESDWIGYVDKKKDGLGILNDY